MLNKAKIELPWDMSVIPDAWYFSIIVESVKFV